LAAAGRIGDRLHTLSVRGHADATWIGLVYRPGATWQFAPLDIDLHSGLAGVALFLAYLGAQTGQRRYTDLAEAALAALRRQIDIQRSRRRQIGALSGWGGVIYSLTHLGQLWRAPALLDQAEQIAALLPPLIANDADLDVMDGAAGCALSLGALATVRPTSALHELLRLCGERLRATAQPMAVGCGWPSADGPPLTGLSHGAAGIAWALQTIADATGSPDLAQLAAAALSYERTRFVAERGNWLDLRADPPRFMTAWCHGAAGIGLSRLQLPASSSDPQLRAEIAAAVSTTLREGWGRSHTLCHGDLGNLELLLQAGARDMLPDWQTTVYRLAARVLADEPRGWQCGLSVALETPGLMVGLAGIGYGLLRLAAPATVPAVLTFDPPAPR
jgi:type 2 lantibiotic biosynthesis protein LanM